MAITRTAITDDDGTGTTGTILNNAWKQEFYGQIDATFGTIVDIPYNAANFTSDAGTWTVEPTDVQSFWYVKLTNNLVFLSFSIFSSSVTGTPFQLRIKHSAGNCSSECRNIIQVIDNNVQRYGMAQTILGQNLIYCLATPASPPWTTSTNATYVIGEIFFTVA